MERLRPDSVWSETCRGMLAALQGDPAAARAALDRLRKRGETGELTVFFVGFVHFSLGEQEAFLACLERAFELHSLPLLELMCLSPLRARADRPSPPRSIAAAVRAPASGRMIRGRTLGGGQIGPRPAPNAPATPAPRSGLTPLYGRFSPRRVRELTRSAAPSDTSAIATRSPSSVPAAASERPIDIEFERPDTAGVPFAGGSVKVT